MLMLLLTELTNKNALLILNVTMELAQVEYVMVKTTELPVQFTKNAKLDLLVSTKNALNN